MAEIVVGLGVAAAAGQLAPQPQGLRHPGRDRQEVGYCPLGLFAAAEPNLRLRQQRTDFHVAGVTADIGEHQFDRLLGRRGLPRLQQRPREDQNLLRQCCFA